MRSHRALKTHLTLNARGKVHRVPDSSILFHHSWISSSQSFQKETRHAYQMMMLLFFFVSTGARTTAHGTRPVSRHLLGISHDPMLTSTYHGLNQTTEASSPQGSQSLPTTSQARIQTSASPSLYAFNSVRYLRNSSALNGEATTWACIPSLGTLSIAIEYSRTAS